MHPVAQCGLLGSDPGPLRTAGAGRKVTEVAKLTTLLCLTLQGRKVSHIFMISFCTFRMSLEFRFKIPLKLSSQGCIINLLLINK